MRGSPGGDGAFRQWTQSEQQIAHPQTNVSTLLKTAAELVLLSSGKHKAWLPMSLSPVFIYPNTVIASPRQDISLSLQYLPYPAMSPTCQLPLMEWCGCPTVAWSMGVQSDWPAGARNHTRTAPLGSTNFYFPFLFSSQLL